MFFSSLQADLLVFCGAGVCVAVRCGYGDV